MYLAHCPKDNYFQITELWFDYAQRQIYNSLQEGDIIYVIENDGKVITIADEKQDYTFTYHQALDVYGEQLRKNKQKCIKF